MDSEKALAKPESELDTQSLRRSCDACSRKKKRCDGKAPCNLCFRLQTECTYSLKLRPGPSSAIRRRVENAGGANGDLLQNSASVEVKEESDFYHRKRRRTGSIGESEKNCAPRTSISAEPEKVELTSSSTSSSSSSSGSQQAGPIPGQSNGIDIFNQLSSQGLEPSAATYLAMLGQRELLMLHLQLQLTNYNLAMLHPLLLPHHASQISQAQNVVHFGQAAAASHLGGQLLSPSDMGHVSPSPGPSGILNTLHTSCEPNGSSPLHPLMQHGQFSQQSQGQSQSPWVSLQLGSQPELQSTLGAQPQFQAPAGAVTRMHSGSLYLGSPSQIENSSASPCIFPTSSFPHGAIEPASSNDVQASVGRSDGSPFGLFASFRHSVSSPSNEGDNGARGGGREDTLESGTGGSGVSRGNEEDEIREDWLDALWSI